MRRCLSCICHTCLIACCDRKNCSRKVSECEKYTGFKQLSIFDIPRKKEYKPAPREPWSKYGLEDKTYRKKLCIMCRSGKYREAVRVSAYRASEEIAEYIIKSVTKNKSYDKLEFDIELGRICVCKTDFYGYRRLFYHFFDLEIKKIEKDKIKWYNDSL